MRRKTYYIGILILVGVLVHSSPVFSASSEPQSEEAKQTMALVDQAASLLQSKGKEAFTEFRKKDSKWLKDDTYIFVFKMNGIELFHPIKPDLVGTNIIELKDVNGKAYVQETIETAKTQGSGWIDYMLPKPGESKPSKKISYFKKVKVGEETFIVGSGFYTD